jgi:hypothetical protein
MFKAGKKCPVFAKAKGCPVLGRGKGCPIKAKAVAAGCPLFDKNIKCSWLQKNPGCPFFTKVGFIMDLLVILTRFNYVPSLQMEPTSQSVCSWQAFAS